MASGQMVNDQVTPSRLPLQRTHVQLCHNASGLHFHANATDNDVFNTATACNADVFSDGDVVEFFVAPVATVYDNPSWYYEIDTAASTGALWASLSHNPLGRLQVPYGPIGGNVTECGGDCCAHPAVSKRCGSATVTGGQTGAACNASNLVACNLACTGAASFPNGGPSVTVSQGSGWWGASLFVPFDLFDGFLSAGPSPPPLWRLNMYRCKTLSPLSARLMSPAASRPLQPHDYAGRRLPEQDSQRLVGP